MLCSQYVDIIFIVYVYHYGGVLRLDDGCGKRRAKCRSQSRVVTLSDTVSGAAG